jgi:hypothetical protein
MQELYVAGTLTIVSKRNGMICIEPTQKYRSEFSLEKGPTSLNQKPSKNNSRKEEKLVIGVPDCQS